MLFLEIVSEVIFAVSSASDSRLNEPPVEDGLIAELIETIIPTTGPTQQLSPFPLNDSSADKTPIIRSNILQLLLGYKYVHVILCTCGSLVNRIV